jgi:hypothetical protein
VLEEGLLSFYEDFDEGANAIFGKVTQFHVNNI